jgi:hypothetical protein
VVDDGKLAQDPVSFGGDLQEYFPPVGGVAAPFEEIQLGHPVRKFHDAVMSELQLPGQRADGRRAIRGKSLDGQEHLVLLGLKSGRARGLFAEDQETADQVAEAGQSPIVAEAGPGA